MIAITRVLILLCALVVAAACIEMMLVEEADCCRIHRKMPEDGLDLMVGIHPTRLPCKFWPQMAVRFSKDSSYSIHNYCLMYRTPWYFADKPRLRSTPPFAVSIKFSRS